MKKIIFSYMALALFGQQLCAMQEEHSLIMYARNGVSNVVKSILKGSVSQEDKDRALEYATVHAGQSSGNYYNTIYALLKAGADVNTASGRPLRSVASMGNEELLERFLEVPNINLDARGAFGETPLTDAVKHGRAKIFARLITAGASFTQQTKDFLLILAARQGHEDLVNTLIEMGSDIRSRAYAGQVEGEACRLARYYKHTNIVNIFTRLYAASNAPNVPKVVVVPSYNDPVHAKRNLDKLAEYDHDRFIDQCYRGFYNNIEGENPNDQLVSTSSKDETARNLAQHAQKTYDNSPIVDMHNSFLQGDLFIVSSDTLPTVEKLQNEVEFDFEDKDMQ